MEAPSGSTTRQKERYLLKEDEQKILGKQALYRLYEFRGAGVLYEVEIKLAGECERASLGDDFTRAADIYKALFLGEVTPCTLKILSRTALTEFLRGAATMFAAPRKS